MTMSLEQRLARMPVYSLEQVGPLMQYPVCVIRSAGRNADVGGENTANRILLSSL